MIWLFFVGAASVGLLQSRHDTRALELAGAAAVLALVLVIAARIDAPPDALRVDARALALFGGVSGRELVPRFLPAAHVGYAVLLAHAVAPLGRGGVVLASVTALAAVVLALLVGHGAWDVAAGLSIGELLARGVRLTADDTERRDGTNRRVGNPTRMTREPSPDAHAMEVAS